MKRGTLMTVGAMLCVKITNRSEVFLRRLLAALEPPLGFIAAITVFFGLWFVVMQQSQDNLDSDHASP